MAMWRQLTTAVVGASLLAACQGPVHHMPSIGLDRIPVTLANPAVMDWSTQRVSGAAISEQRAASMKRRVQAFAAMTGWTSTGDALNNISATLAGDDVPNGPGAVYGTSGTPAVCFNKIFYLTRSGKLLRVANDKTSPSVLNLGHTCSKTYVSLSPAGGRVYILADDGAFIAVNVGATPMVATTVTTGATTGNLGLAPVLDPFVSDPADNGDTVYVPYANGTVQSYTVKNGATPASQPAATFVGSYSVCGPLKGNPIVLNGVVYAGDANGNFVRFDTASNAATFSTTFGNPVLASPTLDLDAAGNVTDAFVNAGMQCQWINFPTNSVTGSSPLYLDEGDTKKSGTLNQWTYTATPIKYWLQPTAAFSMNRDTGGLAPKYLNGFSDFKTQSYLCVADENTRPESSTATQYAQGGPVDMMLRWDITNSPLPSTATVSGIKLWLKVQSPQRQLRTYGAFKISPYVSGTTPFTFSNVTSQTQLPITRATGTNANPYSPIATLNMTGVSTTPQNRVYWNQDTWYNWTVTTSSFSAAAGQYALAFYNDPNGDTPMWPEPRGGIYAPEDSGAAAQKSERRGPQFYADPTNTNYSYLTGTGVADPTGISAATGNTAAGTDYRPMLEVSAIAKALSVQSIPTPPIVDGYAGRRMIYVVNGNVLFGLDYTSAATFASASSTRFNVLTCGMKGTGPNTTTIPYGTVYPPQGGNLYVADNETQPLLSYDGTAVFALSRFPAAYSGTTPTSFIYALDRIGLPMTTANATAGAVAKAEYQRTGATYYSASKEASMLMVIDDFSYNASTGALHFALPPLTNSTTGTIFRIQQN